MLVSGQSRECPLAVSLLSADYTQFHPIIQTARIFMSSVSQSSPKIAGYKLGEDDAIDATRALRSALHGFITLESGGGFGLPVDIDRSFARLVNGIATAFSSWTSEPAVTR